MKIPSLWSKGSDKAPAKWGSSLKTPQQWDGSSLVKTDAPAQVWGGVSKNASTWGDGEWLYDAYLPYNSSVSYNGTPKPLNAKMPASWSNT